MKIKLYRPSDLDIFALFLLAVVATLGMFFFNLETASGIWSGSVSRYLLAYLVVFFSLIICGRIFFGNSHKLFVTVVLLLFFVAHCGLSEFLSVALFFVSSYCLGNMLLKWALSSMDDRPMFIYSSVVGAALLVLVFGVLILIRGNTQGLYIVYLFVPAMLYALKRNKLQKPVIPDVALVSIICSHINSSSTYRYYAFLMLFTYISSYCFFPTVTWDEQALHLSVWTQLTATGQFLVDPEHQVWTAAPNLVALIHGITSLVAGADTKSAMNFYLFVFTIGGVFSIFKKINLNVNDSITLATLYVSTPIIAILMVTLQTDLSLGLCLVCAVLCVLSLDQDGIPAALGGLFCGALALSAKLPGILIAAPMAILVLLHFLRSKYYKSFNLADWLRIILLLTIALGLALWAYAKAFYYTGNPVFPLYNSIFESPYIGVENFRDNRWYHGANLDSFAGLFFETMKHMEVSNNFVGGFQYFLLVPVAVLIAFWRAHKNFLIISFVVFFYFAPIFYSLQYLRYFYAVMPLASVLIAIFFLTRNNKKIFRHLSLFSIYLITVLNFSFMPGVSWLFDTSPLSLLDDRAAEKKIRDITPEVDLNRMVGESMENPKVFFAHTRPFGATLNGQPIYNAEYSYSYYKNRDRWSRSEDLLKDFSAWGVDFVYWDQKEMFRQDDFPRNLLREVLYSYGKPVFQSNYLVAFTISDRMQSYTPVFSVDRATEFRVTGNPVRGEGATVLHENDVLSVDIDMSSYSAFRYQVQYVCESKADFFVAQLNWDNGSVFYKLLECSNKPTLFSEVGMVPPGAKMATVYLSARTTSTVNVSSLSIAGK